MRFSSGQAQPSISPDAWVAPTAVIRGDVSIGAGSAILFGAVITAEGGPVAIGEECVIMENAVLCAAPPVLAFRSALEHSSGHTPI